MNLRFKDSIYSIRYQHLLVIQLARADRARQYFPVDKNTL